MAGLGCVQLEQIRLAGSTGKYRVRTHAYARAYVRAYARFSCAYARAYCTYARAYAGVRTYVRTHVHTHAYARAYAWITHVRTHAYACRAYARAYTPLARAYARAYATTNVRTHTNHVRTQYVRTLPKCAYAPGTSRLSQFLNLEIQWRQRLAVTVDNTLLCKKVCVQCLRRPCP